MRNLVELKINEAAGRPVSRLAPSLTEVIEFEKKFGISIPDGVMALLEFSNGGHPELNALDGAAGEYAIDHFYHLTENDKGTESIWYAMESWRPILGEKILPFAGDGGGNLFFLDLSTEPASVKICLHDEEFKIVELASTFADFINRLDVDPDMI